MINALRFGGELIGAPSKALKRLQSPGAGMSESVVLYIVFVASAVLFYTWKPEGFPPPSPDAPIPLLPPGRHGLAFWIRVQMWEPVLTGLWVLCLAAFAGLFRSEFGSLRVKVVLAFLSVLAPGIGILYYRFLPNWVLALIWLVLLAGYFPLLRQRAAGEWKRLLSLAMAMNIIGIALLPAVVLSVVIESSWVYNALHYAMLFWTIGLGSYLLRELEGISTPRAFITLIFSLFWQIFLVVSLHFLDLISKDILKAIMTV